MSEEGIKMIESITKKCDYQENDRKEILNRIYSNIKVLTTEEFKDFVSYAEKLNIQRDQQESSNLQYLIR